MKPIFQVKGDYSIFLKCDENVVLTPDELQLKKDVISAFKHTYADLINDPDTKNIGKCVITIKDYLVKAKKDHYIVLYISINGSNAGTIHMYGYDELIHKEANIEEQKLCYSYDSESHNEFMTYVGRS